MGQELQNICQTCCVISSALLAFLLMLSFSSLDFNEVGLDYSSITKTVYPHVYHAGFHFLGVGHSFIRFQKTVITVELSNEKKVDRTMIHSRTSDGLEVTLEISFQYIYLVEHIFEMFATFKVDHHEILINMAVDTLSEVSNRFSAYQFFMDRQYIGNYFQKELDNLFRGQLYCYCEFFQLRSVDLPDPFENAIQSSEVKKQEIIKAEAEKNKTQVELETKKMGALYYRQVAINNAYGEGNATLSNGRAKADAFQTVQDTNSKAISSLKKTLKLDNKQLIEYMKAKTLRDYEGNDILIFID